MVHHHLHGIFPKHPLIQGKSPTSTLNPAGIHWSKDSKDCNRASRAKSRPSRSGSPYRPLCCFRSSKNWSPSWAGKLRFTQGMDGLGNGMIIYYYYWKIVDHSLIPCWAPVRKIGEKSGRKEENSQSRHFQTLKMCKINWEKNMPKAGNTSCFQQLKT